MIKNFLNYGNGCVVFMDYYNFSKLDYGTLVYYYEPLRDVLYKKLISTGNYSRIFIFGFSFGARLSQGAGFKITQDNGGVPQIKDMHLCEPAGPYFDGYPRRVNPLMCAKNTQCINTSYDKGTYYFDCKQNFRMGYCGWSQVASGPYPKVCLNMFNKFHVLLTVYLVRDHTDYALISIIMHSLLTLLKATIMAALLLVH
jgi:hypothetical protein